MFTRTISGLINKFLFYPKPIVWVEGPDDISFYGPIVNDLPCRIEPAGGKIVCEKLAEAIIQNDYPFVVILDGDFDFILGINYEHERVIYLQKYSIENYYFEKQIVENIWFKYVGDIDTVNRLGQLFDEMEKDVSQNFTELIVLDIANMLGKNGLTFFPNAAEIVIDIQSGRCESNRIEKICEDTSRHINDEEIVRARNIVKTYNQEHRFIDLVRGHIILGMMRNLICRGIHLCRKPKPYIDNRSMHVILSSELWNLQPSSQYRQLVHVLRTAATQAMVLRSRNTE